MSQEATIRRGVRNARYAAIPNHVFEDMRLSMEARWLLGYLLSKPDNWTVVQKDIANKGGCGRDKARKMIAELVEAGYAEKEQARDSGRFGGMSLVIYDEPLNSAPVLQSEAGSVAFLPQTDLPATVNPSTETPSPVNQALVSTDNLENTNYRSERARESAKENREERKATERSFKKAFSSWPTFLSDSEPDASRAWLNLSIEERQLAYEETGRYVEAARLTGRKHICSFAVYLREKRWEKLPARPAAASLVGIDGAEQMKAPPFGKLWFARVYEQLLAGSTQIGNLDKYERQLVEDGKFTAQHLLMEKQAKQGFPQVNDLFERASGARGALVPAWLQPVAERMVPVQVGSDVWCEWIAEHTKRGWPWPDVGRMEYVHLPSGGPDALNDLQDQLRGLDK